MIGEVRSAETMAQALTFAETGHLCLCTLHANNANQALDRSRAFPAELHNQVWMDLSLNLKSMVAQQLLPRKDGKGRAPVVEVLLNSPLVADYIRKGEVHLIKDLMAKSTELGMQTSTSHCCRPTRTVLSAGKTHSGSPTPPTTCGCKSRCSIRRCPAAGPAGMNSVCLSRHRIRANLSGASAGASALRVRPDRPASLQHQLGCPLSTGWRL